MAQYDLTPVLAKHLDRHLVRLRRDWVAGWHLLDAPPAQSLLGIHCCCLVLLAVVAAGLAAIALGHAWHAHVRDHLPAAARLSMPLL